MHQRGEKLDAIKALIVEGKTVTSAFLTRVVTESFSDTMLVSEAADADSARLLLSQANHLHDPYRLVLIDLELPEGSGMALLTELAGEHAIKIATTLYSDDEHLFPALQSGASGYLLKENRFEVLVEALQKIVRGQPALSPAIARRLLAYFRGDAATNPAPPDAGIVSLAPRETEALTYLSKGFTLKEVANLMGIKAFAVNDHIKAIYRKLSLAAQAQHASL